MTTPNSAATPASAMKPTALATDIAWPSSQMNQKPPTSANGNGDHDQRGLVERRGRSRYSSTKMMASVAGTTTFKPLRCTLEILELARPRDRVARRQLHLSRDARLHLGTTERRSRPRMST